ncbi:MAG: hypothetical protein ACE5FH_11020 [Candidatus Zixiibacteriota bacterium]
MRPLHPKKCEGAIRRISWLIRPVRPIDKGGYILVKRIALLIVMTLCCSQVSAEITLKHGFFAGWKYSTDGVQFKKVGRSGDGLYWEMEGNEKAQAHMKKYKKGMTWATVTAVPGGFLIGWPIGGYIGSGGEWKDSYTTMMIIGAPLAVVSTLLEGSAKRHLTKAVDLYNRDESSIGFMLNIKPAGADHSVAFIAGLKYQF